MSNLITPEYLKNNNTFSSDVYDVVKNIINERQQHYAKKARGTVANTNTMNWLYEKTAYVLIDVMPSGSTKFNRVLEPPKGGFRSDTSPLYTSDLFPQPVVNSVRITNDGDYNTLMRTSIDFNVYSLAQLKDQMNGLLKVGSKVKVNYGWTAGKYVEDPFIGVVYNFNWTLQPDGTFKCTSESVGEGFFPAGMRPDFTENKPANSKTDNETLTQITWIDNIRNDTTITDSRIQREVELKGIKSPDASNDKNPSVSESQIYVTLGYVAETIQRNIRDSGNIKTFTLLCNDTISKGHKYIIKDRPLVSANPINIIFPGKSSSYFGQGGTNVSLIKSPDFDLGQNDVNLSNIFINVNFLDNCIKLLKNQTTESGGRYGSYTLHTFFKLIFDEISACSGEFYQLTIVPAQPPLGVTDEKRMEYLNTLLIVDTNYVLKSNTFTIPVMTSDGKSASGIARSVSLTSKLPQAMQVAQYIGTASEFTSGMTPGIQKYTAPPDTQEVKNKIDAYPKLIHKLQQNGWLDERDQDAIKALYKLYKTSEALQTKSGGIKINSQLPIPLDLSITIDGTGGFRFGNNITIDYLPEQYKDAQFMITKIEHTFQNNDWTTTLNTVHRAS